MKGTFHGTLFSDLHASLEGSFPLFELLDAFQFHTQSSKNFSILLNQVVA